MNNKEWQMAGTLSQLRNDYGATEVKAEFETEGTRLNELMRLKDVASRAGVGIVLKIGGPEAVRDIHDALLVGVDSIVAPMVESAYALSKYLEAIEKHVPEDVRKGLMVAVNIETVGAYQEFSDMLKLPNINILNRITVGRGDLCGSMGLGRRNADDINSEKVLVVTMDICGQAKTANLETTLGGWITPESIPFVGRLAERELLNSFETRKVVFDATEGLKDPMRGLELANDFEACWLENKRDLYARIAAEDEARIKTLRSRKY